METWFWKPKLWNPRKIMISIFSFVSQQLLILFFSFSQASAVKPGVWTYFSVIAFWCFAAKEGFQTQLFKTQILTQTDTEQTQKKAIFWFTLTGLVSCQFVKSAITNFIHPSFQLHGTVYRGYCGLALPHISFREGSCVSSPFSNARQF